MNESDYKLRLVKAINAIDGAYASRWEDKWAVGRLDLIIKLPGLPWTFAEGKIIDGNLFAPTEKQHFEGERIIKAGGAVVVLIGWKNGQMYVSPWVKQADIRTCYASRNVNEVVILREFITWRQREKLDAG